MTACACESCSLAALGPQRPAGPSEGLQRFQAAPVLPLDAEPLTVHTSAAPVAQEPPAPMPDGYHCPDCGCAHWPHEPHGSNPRDLAPGSAQEPADPPLTAENVAEIREWVTSAKRGRLPRSVVLSLLAELDRLRATCPLQCTTIRGQS